jgi:Zn-dependent peptidase ImmA (M78 family)
VSNARSAEAQALELLQKTYAGGPPVPVEDIARARSAQLTYEAFEEDVSGLLYRDKDRVVIGVNSTHAPTRQRFTIAHELGHLMMHEGRQAVFVDRLVRMNLRDGSSSEEEVDANAFAASLLMPKSLILDAINWVFERTPRIGPGDLADQLAGTFRVSPEAMRYRLENLGIVDPGTTA